jgi:hypothetical protein
MGPVQASLRHLLFTVPRFELFVTYLCIRLPITRFQLLHPRIHLAPRLHFSLFQLS